MWCRVCSKEIFDPKHPNHITCSMRCSAVWRGNMQRGRGNAKTYRKYNGRHEHRVVAEWILDRPLRPGEIVHHKDGNKQNNDPDNLEITNLSDHAKLHNREHFTCTVAGCNGKHVARGLCDKHYCRWKRSR